MSLNSIRMWIMRPVNNHTWSNFKTHFEEAHRVLRAVQEKTLRSAAYHHINSLASQVLLEEKSVQENIMQVIETHTSQIDTEYDKVTTPPQAQTANATTPDVVQLEMLRVIKDLQREMKELKKMGQGTGNFTQRNGVKKKRVRKKMTKYC